MALDFYRSGPLLIRERLSHYLRLAVGRGDLAIDDIPLAADQFAQLCKADIQDRLIFGATGCCTPGDLNRTIAGAVSMFLARYGVTKTDSAND
jgi:hypothetical protein